MPCEIGREYLFFVNTYRSSDHWENVYTPSVYEMGRYPAISSNARTNTTAADYSVEESNLVIDDSHYRSIYQEVIEKYF